MYYVLDVRNKSYVLGEFHTVINSSFKWYIKDNILHYKTRDYAAETFDIGIEWMTKAQLYTLVMNYLWNQLDRFDYEKNNNDNRYD